MNLFILRDSRGRVKEKAKVKRKNAKVKVSRSNLTGEFATGSGTGRFCYFGIRIWCGRFDTKNSQAGMPVPRFRNGGFLTAERQGLTSERGRCGV